MCFNPHPARGPSATRSLARPTRCGGLFQSSPGPWAECNYEFDHLPDGKTLFQSSPGPWAECNGCRPARPHNTTWGFNPHPARGPSATRSVASPTPSIACFNPHPARGPSATKVCKCGHRICQRVSILTRPVGRVQHNADLGHRQHVPVSILTRPVGRVQQPQGGLYAGLPMVSILTRPVGRVQQSVVVLVAAQVLVSILPRPVGRVQRAAALAAAADLLVSILTRPVGRVQLAPFVPPGLEHVPFQSSPGPWAECNSVWPMAIG